MTELEAAQVEIAMWKTACEKAQVDFQTMYESALKAIKERDTLAETLKEVYDKALEIAEQRDTFAKQIISLGEQADDIRLGIEGMAFELHCVRKERNEAIDKLKAHGIE